MKEDILEQLTEDCLHSRGYFTKSNVKYKPDPACTGFISQLCTPKSTSEPYNIYIYDLSESLGIMSAGSRRISVTIDADNLYTPQDAFNIKAFSLVVVVAPSFAG